MVRIWPERENRGLAAAAAALLALALTGCPGGGGGGGAPTAEENLALTEAMFRTGEIVEVAIEMDPADWDELRFRSRSILDVVGSTCLEPPTRPFEYYPATVTVNGERVEMVGVRKKGFFGSLDDVKPSLKVKFDEYVPEQRLSGLSRMTLNNNKSDPSHLKQCLGYEIFAKAGIPSPRCNFARVAVNGKGLGIFTNVESIKKQFLLRYFPDNEGDLWEGALSDFRPDWVGTFQRKTNKWLDEAQTDANLDTSDLDALVPLLQLPDDQLLSALEPHLDVDAFLDFWITELIISHADGYARNTNNFYLYFDPDTGRMHFIPWGIDSIFHVGNRAAPWEERPPASILWEEGVLSQRLYRHPTMGPLYLSRLPQLLDALWDEDALLARVDQYYELLSPFVADFNRDGFEEQVTAVRYFIRSRRDAITNALAQSPPVTDDQLRDPWCVDQLGTVEATFTTTWGTVAEDDVFSTGTGSLTLDLTVDPMLPPITRVGSKSGYDPNDRQNIVQVVSWHDPNIAVILHLTISNPESLTPGTSLPLDWLDSAGHLLEITFTAGQDPEFEVLGMVGDGVLYLHDAGTEDGDAITGTVSALVYEPLF